MVGSQTSRFPQSVGKVERFSDRQNLDRNLLCSVSQHMIYILFSLNMNIFLLILIVMLIRKISLQNQTDI